MIDHPDGVSLWRSASGSRTSLRDLLSEYALEVSSPGPERPLTKPDHFRRFLGSRARVRTREPRDGHGASPASSSAPSRRRGDRGGRTRGVVSIPYAEITRSNLLERRRRGAGMSKEIVEAIGVLEREKGISADTLMDALEDALLSAYKKTPGSAKYARVDIDRDSGDFTRLRADPPRGARGAAARRGRGGPEEPTVDPETGEMREPEEPEIDPERAGRVQRPDRGARRHAGGLRPHRRPDRQAGDPAADPRGRARHDVRRVPGPRRRADHRHRPAVRLALHARPAARARRGAAAALRAGRTASATTTARASRRSSPTSPPRRRARASSSRAARRS